MMNYLVRGGHRWEDLMDGYSVGLVQNLYTAGREQDRIEHIQLVTGFSTAVINAIDITFGKGKSKVLKEYTKAMLKAGEKEKELIEEHVEGKPKGVKVSKSVMALFGSLPKVEMAGEDNESG